MKPFFVFAVLGLAACGNYSNEDLDFQLALPQDGELEAKLPQSLTLDNSSEYYKLTRRVVTEFNGLAVALVSLVDNVRKTSPTSRNGSERVWGPGPDDKHPGWQIRVLMRRVDDDPAVPPPGFEVSYDIQIRNAAKSDSDFFDLVTGKYSSWGNARRGEGEMHLLVQPAREAGYPVDDLGEMASLDLYYHTLDYPMKVQMVITNVDTAQAREIIYDYAENADGSGALVFDWTVDAAKAVSGETDITFVSRWLGSGAGRADAYATAASLPAGIDCWEPDTVADFVWRLGDASAALGSQDLCVYGAPTSIPRWQRGQ